MADVLTDSQAFHCSRIFLCNTNIPLHFYEIMKAESQGCDDRDVNALKYKTSGIFTRRFESCSRR